MYTKIQKEVNQKGIHRRNLTKWNKCICFNNVVEYFVTAINIFKELNMFEVSEKAGEVIKQFIEGREGPHSIRIALNEGG